MAEWFKFVCSASAAPGSTGSDRSLGVEWPWRGSWVKSPLSGGDRRGAGPGQGQAGNGTFVSHPRGAGH